MTLIEMLSSIEDTRKRRGIRHKMPNFLIMCLTAIMSGYTGYREIGRFLKENQWEFKKYLTFCKVPTYGSIRRIFMEIDFDDTAQFLPMCQGETLAVDGKAIAGTIKDTQNNYQNFVSLISVFASQRGIVLACDKLENKKESEIYTVQRLLQALDIQGEIITLDALHCQKNS